MRITGIDVTELRVPDRDAAGFDGSWDDCIVQVRTDAGITGVAEVDSVPSVVRAIIEAPPSHVSARGLKELLVGRDPADIAGLWELMYDGTGYYGRRGVVIHAISAIDIALWDIRGKVEGRPLVALLGGTRRERVTAYGTVYPLGRNPDHAKRNIDRALALGLRAIKICAEPSWRDHFSVAERLIRTAREHVGHDIALMLDAAGAWRVPEDGLPLMPVLRDCDFEWVEAPLPLDDIAGHGRFQGFGIPIAGGDLGLTTRFEFEQMFEIGKVDIAQSDVTMAGGLTELLRIARIADRRGARLVPHGYKSNITIACNLAFLGSSRREEMLEYSTSSSPLRWSLTDESFEIGPDGKVAVPNVPGLGVTLNTGTVDRFRA